MVSPAKPAIPKSSSTQFFLKDYDSTLFPLATNRLMVEKFAAQILEFIQSEDLIGNGSFLLQQRVFASKRGWFLRPTVKLDPVAEFFLYDFVYRNRTLFRKPPIPNRQSFGFFIANGEAEPILKSYSTFKKAIASERTHHKNYIYFDIASYFNHIYQHHLVEWAEKVGAAQADVNLLGKFLREIRGGESFDCLPQGLYPAKMIGSSFLSFLEESSRVHAAKTLRLMDDVWLFDDDEDLLVSDFLNIQSQLSKRGLNINEEKSKVLTEHDPNRDVPADLDEMKVKLLQRRRAEFEMGAAYYDEGDEETEGEEIGELTEEEIEYLIGLLSNGDIQEEDAELVLALMRDAKADINDYLPVLIESFPGLTKRLYYFCLNYQDRPAIADAIYAHIKSGLKLTEFQLFWFAKITEDILIKSKKAGGLLMSLYDHESATPITKAKILEIPEMRFGMPDLREEQLRTGQSGWLAWSSAVGTRTHPKGKRNHLLKYFRKASPMNRLIGEFVEQAF
jgi:hypothetical protein